MGVHARAIEVGERECGGKRRGKRASVAGLDEGKCVWEWLTTHRA